MDSQNIDPTDHIETIKERARTAATALLADAEACQRYGLDLQAGQLFIDWAAEWVTAHEAVQIEENAGDPMDRGTAQAYLEELSEDIDPTWIEAADSLRD